MGLQAITDVKMKLEGLGWTNFMGSIKSSQSLETYMSKLIVFGRFCQQFRPIQTPDDLLTKDAEPWIIAWFVEMRKQGLSYSTINNGRSALKSFYSINDIVLNWSKITRFLPEADTVVEDRAYTKQELLTLLKTVRGLRERAIILTLVSTGMRVGGLVNLRLKHLKKMGDVYKIRVYENTPERYTCFCSTECAQAIDLYLKDRQSCFEQLTQDSFVFRNAYRRTKKVNVGKAPDQITVGNIQNVISYYAIRAGLRVAKSNETKSLAIGRHETMLVHGMRKYAEGEMQRAGIQTLTIDRLLGHDIGLHKSYYKMTDEELLAEYLKAEPRLCIELTHTPKQESITSLQRQLEKLQKEIIAMKEGTGTYIKRHEGADWEFATYDHLAEDCQNETISETKQ